MGGFNGMSEFLRIFWLALAIMAIGLVATFVYLTF
jgi:hypothetical protein